MEGVSLPAQTPRPQNLFFPSPRELSIMIVTAFQQLFKLHIIKTIAALGCSLIKLNKYTLHR